MASKNQAAATSAKESRRFFEKQLKGEEPLHFETASQLYEFAPQPSGTQPGDFLADDDGILMMDPDVSERLGFEACVTKTLPAVDDFKGQLFAMMGGSGPIPIL